MLKRVGLIAAFAVIAAAIALGLYLYLPADEQPSAPPKLTSEDLHQAASDAVHSDSATLALKAITLSQGEGGAELWRLKASWAGMAEKDGRIVVDKPRLIYFMPPDNAEMHVNADKGDIDQKSHILRFIGDVVATMQDRSLTGKLLIYNGGDKTMTFPDGAAFQEPGLHGDARHVVWHVDDRTVTAEGDVTVVFEQSPAELTAPEPGRE